MQGEMRSNFPTIGSCERLLFDSVIFAHKHTIYLLYKLAKKIMIEKIGKKEEKKKKKMKKGKAIVL